MGKTTPEVNEEQRRAAKTRHSQDVNPTEADATGARTDLVAGAHAQQRKDKMDTRIVAMRIIVSAPMVVNVLVDFLNGDMDEDEAEDRIRDIIENAQKPSV